VPPRPSYGTHRLNFDTPGGVGVGVAGVTHSTGRAAAWLHGTAASFPQQVTVRLHNGAVGGGQPTARKEVTTLSDYHQCIWLAIALHSTLAEAAWTHTL